MTTQTKQALPTGNWSADKVHSTIGFAIDYMAGTFQGTFAEFDAKLADDRLTGVAEVASIQVKDENLAAHLQSPEFFDAERYPQLRFESGGVSRSGEELSLNGEVTLKGHTEPVEITGRISDPADDAFGNVRFGLQLEATIDRTVFRIDWNNELPNGDPALSDEVKIVADLQLVREA